MSETKGKKICLFDIDGTLTPSRLAISEEMERFLCDLQKKIPIGLVGGSDLEKLTEQMGEGILKNYNYVFPENGLVAYKDGIVINKQSISEYMGEEKLQMLINFCLQYMSTLVLPLKRGNFIEFRTGLINICPVGRSCSQAERKEFAAYDKVHKIREKFVLALKEKFPDIGLTYSIGGEISFDCFPVGWDKTFCLKYIQQDGYDEIYFFGDKTFPGGNDYEIFSHKSVIGHRVTNPEDTMQQLRNKFEM